MTPRQKRHAVASGEAATSVRVEPFSRQADVVDAAVEAYVHWREECADARDAYLRWESAEKGDRVLAFSAYTAALDREETAASIYSEAMRRLGDECFDAWRAEPRRVWGGCSS
jgi:hypothetical protein